MNVDWQHQAACRTADGAVHWMFFPPGNGTVETPPARSARENAAREICDGCPVVDDCTAYALHYSAEFGIWGGIHGERLVREHRLKDVVTRSDPDKMTRRQSLRR